MSAALPNTTGKAQTLQETMEGFRAAMAGSSFSMLEVPELMEFYKDQSVGDRWEELCDNDEAAVDELHNLVHDRYKAFPYKLVARSVPASTAYAFAELISMLHGQDAVQQMLAGYYPVPLFQIGPVFVVGHFNAGFPLQHIFPPDLFIPVWLTIADYRAVHTDLLSQLQFSVVQRAPGSEDEHQKDASATDTPKTKAAGSEQKDTTSARITKAPDSLSSFAATCARERNESDESAKLRIFARWLRTFPGLAMADDQALGTLTTRDEELTEEAFPADLRLLFRHFVHGDTVVRTDLLEINPKLRKELDPRLTGDHQLCPIAITDRYCFLLSDAPLGHKLLDDFSNHTALTPVPVIVSPQQFQSACSESSSVVLLTLAEASSANTSESLAFELQPNQFTPPDQLPQGALENPELLLQFIMSSAVGARAADVHLEWVAGTYRVRFTIDGVGQEAIVLPGHVHDGLASRVKSHTQIHLDAIGSESGRFVFAIGTREIETRVQLIFDMHRKARFALRLRDKTQPIKDVSSLGMSASDLGAISDIINSPDGILYVCGPTGAGKSTTLSAALNEINRPSKVIFAFEDPPEYEIPGITHQACTADPLKARPNLPTFATAVKDVLRMGPHVISIGEIRDLATAEIAVQASLTGHSVFTSLHTDSALNGIQRLVELGIDANSFATTAKGFLCQRLVRRVCRCHKLEPITERQRQFFKDAGVDVPSYRSRLPVVRGCPQCRGTGYSERIAVFELLKVTDQVQDLLLNLANERVTLNDIRKHAVEKDGFRTLFQNGLSKVIHGYTTLSEIDRVIKRIDRTRREALGVNHASVMRAA